MKRTCIACHKPLTSRWGKYCGNACNNRALSNISKGLPVDYRHWVPQSNCAMCGKEITERGPQAKYCSKRCNLDAGHEQQRKRIHAAKRRQGLPIPGDIVPCANPQCFNAAIYVNLRAFCSDDCQQFVQCNKHWLGEGPSSRVYFYACPDCSAPVLHRAKNGSHKVCPPCRVVRNMGINGRKNHARRAAGPPALSVHQIAERDGNRCHICTRKINMALSGMAKWGATIEHILPVSQGGTNDPSNLALAHRHCNTARGNRGHSQLVLVA
jgi:predicted nucleic acid-binding Zn ribbon protein